MEEPICWQRLPEYVPGQVGLCSDDLGWKNIGVRSYHYKGQDVIVPAMRDFLLVGYRAGVTPMQRRFDGRWSRETLSPGAVSFLTRAQSAHWTWQEPVDVTHIYLSADLVTDVACEVLDRTVEDVQLEDVLRANDPMITHSIAHLAAEAQAQGLGGQLFVDALSRALIVHLLRNYATTRTRETTKGGLLSSRQKRKIVAYIDAHIGDPLDLESLSSTVAMTPCSFARHFKSSFGYPAYAYVIQRRLERAQALLRRADLPIKQIAADCGFSDQAHLTRLFKRTYGVTPSKYRRHQM